MKVLDEAKGIVFDLDGTLYEDTSHFDYYVRLLAKQFATDEKREPFTNDYKKILNGEHAVSIGKIYDLKEKTILTVDPFTKSIENVQEWDGSLWSKEKAKQTYGQTVTLDASRFIAIGDGWWPPVVASNYHGLDPHIVGDTYNNVKEYMVGDQFELTRTPGLKQGLRHLKQQSKVLILMTNSDSTDVKRLLHALDLEDIFTELITSANKPFDVDKHLKGIMSHYHINPDELVSVGDNFMNEIAPALNLGMKGVHINPRGASVTHPHVTVVKSLANEI